MTEVELRNAVGAALTSEFRGSDVAIKKSNVEFGEGMELRWTLLWTPSPVQNYASTRQGFTLRVDCHGDKSSEAAARLTAQRVLRMPLSDFTSLLVNVAPDEFVMRRGQTVAEIANPGESSIIVRIEFTGHYRRT